MPLGEPSGQRPSPSPDNATAPERVASRPTGLSPENRAAQRAFDGQSPQTLSPSWNTSAPPGLRLWSGLSPTNRAANRALAEMQPEPAFRASKIPWSLGTDLDKYRAHAVKDGSRNSGESLGKALARAGLALEDGANIFLLGYGSERGQPFRGNDGKGLLDEPGKVPQQAGATMVSLGDGLYSIADLITLDALPDHKKGVYRDNNPLVRPLVFTGRTIGGVWKTTEEIGNAVTWGYFDNVTGAVGMCLENIIEVIKHVGQATTNLVRLPMHLIGGKDEKADEAMDWILLVPLEFVSNTVEMKGIANTQDYEAAFAEKGVIGSVLEFGGSTFLVYRAVDELIDDDKKAGKQTQTADDATPPDTPAPSGPPPGFLEPGPTEITVGIPDTGMDTVFYFDGEWPNVVVVEP